MKKEVPYNKVTSDYARAWQSYASLTLMASGNLTDFDIRQNTLFFGKVRQGWELQIRNDHEGSVRFNDANSDKIDLDPQEGLVMGGLSINNIFLTTTSGARIRFTMVGWN